MPAVPDVADARLTYRVWPADAASFTTQRMSPLRHNIDQHPLFQLDALQALANSLMSSGQCRFLKPGTTQGSAFSHDPSHPQGLSIDEVFARMEQPGAWLALYNVQTDARYRAALERIVDDLRPMVEREQPGIFLWSIVGTMRDRVEREQPDIFRVNGFVFLSAPPSVTPFHIDRENNFWLQLRGRKTMNVWDNTDREVVPATVVEDFIAGGVQVPFQEAFRARSREFDTGPGDGVYFPSTSPHMTRTDTHWVKPGDGISVSLGINFYTSVTRRTARVHQFNRVLRRLGMTPGFPGQSLAADSLKAPMGRWLAAVRYRRVCAPPPAGSF